MNDNVKEFPRDEELQNAQLLQSLARAKETKDQAARDHLPLSEAGLCIDCESICRIGETGCPSCGGRIVFLLTSWIRPAEIRAAMADARMRPLEDQVENWRHKH